MVNTRLGQFQLVLPTGPPTNIGYLFVSLEHSSEMVSTAIN